MQERKLDGKSGCCPRHASCERRKVKTEEKKGRRFLDEMKKLGF
jgi:hypothetical protein